MGHSLSGVVSEVASQPDVLYPGPVNYGHRERMALQNRERSGGCGAREREVCVQFQPEAASLCFSFHTEFPPTNSGDNGWGWGKVSAKGSLRVTHSRYGLQGDVGPATSAPKAGAHTGRGQQGLLKSSLNQPKPPSHLPEAPGHFHSKSTDCTMWA